MDAIGVLIFLLAASLAIWMGRHHKAREVQMAMELSDEELAEEAEWARHYGATQSVFFDEQERRAALKLRLVAP